MSIIDSIRLSGVTYTLSAQTSGGVPESTFSAYTAATDSRISEDEEVTAAGLNALNDRLSEDEEVTAAALNTLNDAVSGKQDTLIAGDNITISGNVISASGGGSITIDSGITSGSTNAVENGAIWSATTYNKEVTLEFDNSSGGIKYSTNFPSGCTTVKVTLPGGSGYMYVYFYSGSTNYQVGNVYIEKYGSTPSVFMNFTDASYTIENNDVIITYPASKGVNKVNLSISYFSEVTVKAVVEGAFVNENTYMMSEVDGKIKALDDKKLDATAYTPTVVDSQLNAASTNPVQNQALYDELVIEGAEEETTLTFTGTSYNYQSTNYPSGCTKVKISNVPTYDNDIINFYSSSYQLLGAANISNVGTLGVSLSFNGASYSIVDGVVIITYPTVSNVSYIKKNQDATTVKAVTTQTTHLIDQVTANTASISGLTDRIGEDEEVTAAGLNALNDAVTGKADADSVYTKTQTDNAITAATSTKQDTLVSGTNIKTINNESILGEGNIDIQGGSTYSGVSGVTINNNNEIYYDGIYKTWLTSKHSNDYAVYWFRGKNAKIWISDNTPTTSNMHYLRTQFSFGGVNKLGSNNGAVAFGQGIDISGFYASSFGQYNYSRNQAEFSVGQYNTSSSASATFGDSGNTLFSVGNGTSTSARHNAFEIRQNGDIYLTKDGQDVKLQDQLGGSSITVDTVLDSGSTNPVENRVIYNKIDEVEQVTGAGLNTLNDKFGGLKLVKLSQAAYDSLTTKDPSTLYVIVD